MSATISISEEDFALVVSAALDARDHYGIGQEALALDKLARRMNLALSTFRTRGIRAPGDAKPLTWRDMPRTFDGAAP